MKQSNKLLALAMGICLFETTTGLAATESQEHSQARLEEAIQKVNLQTESLQKEIKQLKTELQEVKKEKQVLQKKHVPATGSPDTTASSKVELPTANSANFMGPSSLVPRVRFPRTFLDTPALRMAPVMTGPLPAGGTDLDPSAFISFQNSMSQGMFFLEQQQALEKQLNGAPPPYADRPQLLLGGKVEANYTWQSPYGNGSNTSSLDLGTAEIEALAQVSEWASGYMTINYNNSLLDPTLIGSGNPTNNSNIFLNRGFLTIGNLNKSPIFFSAGQMYAPFGAYASNMLSNPTTKLIGRVNTRAAQLGFLKSGFHTSVYAFDGGSNTGNSTMNKWGTEAGYNFSSGQYVANFGAGFISNIADAQGVQLTSGGNGTFGGFSQNSTTERLVHYVPGADLNVVLGRGPLYFIAEGVAATRAYDPKDMTFNTQGAQPKAGHLEAGYNFKAFGKKSIFNVAYEQTWDALAMGLPKHSYIATLSTSIWKNTVEILEFRHDVNYGATDVSSGACTFTDSSGNAFTTCPGPSGGGGAQNTILTQIGVYF